MGIFKIFTNWREGRRIAKARSGSYGRIVGWIEARYGQINENDYIMDVMSKFHQALDYAQKTHGKKATRGLKRYIEEERFKALIKEQ